MSARTRYFVVFAPGHGGAVSKVLSSHRTYRAALKAIEDTTTLCIREGGKRKGDTWYSYSEHLCLPDGTPCYPLATGNEID